MHFVYIIYSKKLAKYYVGESKNPVERLKQHNESFFLNSWTAKANDWELLVKIQFDNISKARKAEHFIKKMKSVAFIEKLVIDSKWIIEKFKSD